MSVIIGVNNDNAKEFSDSIGSCLRVPAEKNPMKHIWVEPDAEKKSEMWK